MEPRWSQEALVDIFGRSARGPQRLSRTRSRRVRGKSARRARGAKHTTREPVAAHRQCLSQLRPALRAADRQRRVGGAAAHSQDSSETLPRECGVWRGGRYLTLTSRRGACRPTMPAGTSSSSLATSRRGSSRSTPSGSRCGRASSSRRDHPEIIPRAPEIIPGLSRDHPSPEIRRAPTSPFWWCAPRRPVGTRAGTSGPSSG